MYHGKAIYNPSGKAGEYSYWACNFYKGCKGGCTYCYLQNGILKKTMGGSMPELKACFKSEDHAREIFRKEFSLNRAELQKNGLYFQFTSDFFPESTELLTWAIEWCLLHNVPVSLLTKQVDWITDNWLDKLIGCEHQIMFGFTLTGHDEMEPGCATNQARIEKMNEVFNCGFHTYASIEPIIDFESSLRMIKEIYMQCDLYKIGLKSGTTYDKHELNTFIDNVLVATNNTPVYFKDSLLKQAGTRRDQLPSNCVTRDFRLF